MNLRQIEIFRAVMISGTVTDAASMLGVTQPVISKVILHVEDVLGVPLFERSRGRLFPTPEARLLFNEIELVWKGIERIQTLSKNISGELGQPLRLVISPSLGTEVVPRAVARIRRSRPELTITADIVPDIPLVEVLLSNQADIGVTLLPVDHPLCVSAPLATGHIVCAMPKDHPLTQLDTIHLHDLVGHSLISFSAESPDGQLLDKAFRALGYQRETKILVRSGQAACWFVRQGCGIALVDEFTIASGAFSGIVVRALEPAISFEISLVHNRFRPISSLSMSFKNALIKVISEIQQK